MMKLMNNTFTMLVVLQVLGLGLASCSNDDEVEINQDVIAFFENELPSDYHSGPTNFIFHEDDGDPWQNVCVLVNSNEELSRIYTGSRSLPSIDFSRYTLAIGRVVLPDSGYSFESANLKSTSDPQMDVYLSSKGGGYMTLSLRYFWKIYPKVYYSGEIPVNVNVR